MSANPSSFEIKESSSWGRFVTASKDFVMNELILDEAPLLVAPIGFKTFKCQKAAGDVYVSATTCVGCFRMLNAISTCCLQCGFPVCSPKCSKEPFHKKYECVLFKNLHIAPKQIAILQLHVIRACLMYKDKEHSASWRQFTLLSSKMNKQTDDCNQFIKKEIKIASELINDICKLEVDTPTIEMILRTFSVNQFKIQGRDENGSSYEANVLYKTGSLFAHSCSPNAVCIILPTHQNGIQRWNLRIYAKRNIYRHESINISYREEFLTSDTASRQKFMAENYNFFCQCQRCLDPTEFNFYTSAIGCSYCGNATVLPDNSLDEFSPWTCGICGDCKHFSVIKCYVADYENSLDSILKYKTLPVERESCLELLLNSSDERNLTANHRLITRTMYYWLEIQNFKDLLEHTMKSQLKFIQILERATKCLKMFRMFAPLSKIVTLELVFASAIASFYFKTKTLCSIEYDQYSLEEKIQIISAIYAHLKIAVQIIMCNPNNVYYVPIRGTVLRRFKFWKTQLQYLDGVETVDIEGVDEMMLSNMIQRNGAMNVLNQIKTSLETFCAWLYKIIMIEDSDLITPDVSLLTQFDFYFTN